MPPQLKISIGLTNIRSHFWPCSIPHNGIHPNISRQHVQQMESENGKRSNMLSHL
uniref:Uncharacterized protein n=1 Tax=Rhizophora mucronata TaxID=61149 RepID=A0A2P2Q3H3_RHIMU